MFKGYAIDHDRQELIYSGSGSTPNVNRALPGCYIRLQKDLDDLVVGNDLFAQLPMIYFSEGGVVAISDSVFILTALRRELGLRNRVNLDAALSRAWIHGMGSQLLGTNTLVDGISFCPPGTKIRIQGYADKPKAQIEKLLVSDLFFDDVTDYKETLFEGARRIAALVGTMPLIPESQTTVQVSGGTDSRVGLAAALLQENLGNYSFTTSEVHPEDFAVAKLLAQKFQYFYGSTKVLNHIPRDQITSWYLSSAGLYDPLASPGAVAMETNFSIGGHGAEVYKGNFRWRRLSAMTPDKVGHASVIQRRKEQIQPSCISRSNTNLVNKLKRMFSKPDAKVGREISEAVYREASSGLHSVGICPENKWASEWHYLCFRNAIHAGRSTMSSLLNVSPILQRELVGLSYSRLNPYPAPLDGSPSVVSDLLIALNPELAMMPFDDPKKNMTQAYVRERSKFLGQVKKVDPYSVIGDPKMVNSGTPNFFIKLSYERGFGGNFSHESVKNYSLEGFELIPDDLRRAYDFPRILVEQDLPAHITGSSWYCIAAGKLMAFRLLD